MKQLTIDVRAQWVLLSMASLVCGCGSSGGDSTLSVTASPAHASMFGEVAVTLKGDFSKLGEIQSVTFNGIQALDISATSSSITLQIQGAPSPGSAHVVITGKSGQGTNDSAFTYDAPAGGAPLTWAAFGASLTMGGQSGGLPPHGQLVSWDSQVARAAGVFLAPALVVDTFAPPLEPAAFVTNCNIGVDQGTLAAGLLTTVTDPKTNETDLRRGRQDATLPTRNFSVGGSTVAQVIVPATGVIGILERVLELPDGVPTALFVPALARSQIDRLVALDPDIAMSADLLFNDAEGAIATPGDLHPESMTPASTLQPELETIAKRLGALHGDYFVGNMPPIEILPIVAEIRGAAIASGAETATSFDAKLAAVHAIEQQYNDALGAAFAHYPKLHVVDVSAALEAQIVPGLEIGGQRITGAKFGGLFSLDFEHLTDTGYALLANVFIGAMNQTLGLHIPTVDLAAVLATDALSPASLAADGVHCSGE